MKSDRPKIAILLATYMGADYLEQQVESIRNQSVREWQLIVRDDGSSDGTAALLERFEQLDPRIKLMESVKAPGDRPLGYCQNFNVLMLYALNAGFDIVFLSDQDDLWHPDKLARQLQVHASTKTPLLCHTDLQLVDREMALLKPSYIQHRGLNPEKAKDSKSILAENNITGCTISVDRRILSSALPIPSAMDNHDMWLGLTASIAGQVQYLDQCLTLYRQHDKNSIGGKNIRQLVWSYKNWTSTKTAHQQKQAGRLNAMDALIERLNGEFDLADIKLYVDICNSESNFITKLASLWSKGFRCQSLGGYILLAIHLMPGR